MAIRPLLALWAVTLVWFVAMVGFVEWRLAPEGAIPLPDTMILGYDAEWLAAWINAMTEAGRARVLGPYRLMDTVFPALLATALIATGGRRHWWLGAMALAYLALDLAENAAIAEIVRAAPMPPEPALPGSAQADRAAMLTLGKWALVAPSLLVAAWLMRARLKRRA